MDEHIEKVVAQMVKYPANFGHHCELPLYKALLQNKFRWKWSEPELLYSREKGILFLECHDVKWYDDYPDVAAWNKLWEFCRDEVEGISGNLWRLGEDNDDIYNDWFGDYYVTDMIRFERNVFFDMYS